MNRDEYKTDSVGGSPVSIGDVSVLSDVESILSLENNHRDSSAVDVTEHVPLVPVPALPLHPEFAYEDGNIEFETFDHVFWVHEFLLKKFSAFVEQIAQAREKGAGAVTNAGRLKIKVDRLSSSSIVAAFRVLYAPVFPGPEAHKFNSETLIKALRIATLYGCPDMRNYAISELERRFTFLPIHRIQMSDEFNLPTWEKPAFVELCRRPEPISKEESKILGLDRLAALSRIRETEQRRKFVELVDKSLGPLDHRGLATDDKLRTDAKYTLKYPQLPKCDCRVQRICDDTQLDDRDRVGSMALVPNNRHSAAAMIGSRLLANQPSGVNDPRLSVVPCQIHKVASRVMLESHTLLKQRNDLAKRLGDLKVGVSSQIPRGDRKDFSVEDEINHAAWVRKDT
ncbi:unnamed protein product [Rhizoctonia solani]|uniref:BTB domain-containing protein n=2 Tax=Rhizoctonia solani TaxID=456999 RepID=A0A8H3D2P3_9AGAM|nr:Med5 domain protein, putative [Rhizoctonia solani AG-3 Rhs1AP]CAE6505317.1 unnamed protein product [Rhizoctonia solani]CAE6515590.1 unnamed protein product [Rhizoctonia solani]